MGRSAKVQRKIDVLLARIGGEPSRFRERAVRRGDLIKEIGRYGLELATREGLLVALLPGVYVHANLNDDHAMRCEAVWVWTKRKVLITGESALHLFDARYPAPEDVCCIGPLEWSAHVPAWVHLRRTTLPTVPRWGKVAKCAPAAIALLDAWACAPPERRKSILYEALWLNIVRPRALIRAAKERRRLPDRAEFDAIMGEFLAGAHSPTEVMAKREVFTGEEFAELEWQVPMVVQGRRRRPDGIHRAARIDLECDGDADHTSPEAVARDRERNTEFASIGWLPVRFSFKELRDRPEWCRRMLAETIAARLPAA
ncbi:hypothetical protein [Demequina phytophila]|uniref:hypothetical protein n=1 Tax=Demequina phytophila TaxID=1638981 RepID=UPI00078373E0|nr:hypothetical protein [Demequina phytophila]